MAKKSADRRRVATNARLDRRVLEAALRVIWEQAQVVGAADTLGIDDEDEAAVMESLASLLGNQWGIEVHDEAAMDAAALRVASRKQR